MGEPGFDGHSTGEKGREAETVKRFRFRATHAGFALALAAFIGIVFVASGGATVPANGVSCQAGGKVGGRGATFQKRAQDAFNAGFTSDVCGNVADTNSGNNMVSYNVYDGGNGGPFSTPTLTGSGYGRKAMMCRTDAFAGTDVPYNTSQLLALNGDPHAQSNYDVIFGGTPGSRNCQSATGTAFGTSFVPFYQPINGSAPTTSYPNASDTAANLMSFPVAGSAVVIGVNLKGSGICSTTPPSTIQLTGKMVSLLFGGDILTWDDSRLETGGVNAGLANCHGAVTRVVRLDDSGTTQIFKNYLSHVDSARSGATCDPSTVWGAPDPPSGLAGSSPNTTWPGFVPSGSAQQGVAATGTCSALDTGDVNGNNGVLDVCNASVAGTIAIAGAVCYADLPDQRAFTCTGTCPVVAAQIRNSTDTSYQSASQAQRANCSFGAVTPPLANAVGLAVSGTPDTWATDNSAGDRGDVTNTGALYPICGITFDLVYSGLSSGAGSGAISELSDNQRRTMYSYFTYILSSAGQANLTSKFYQALPNGLVDSLRSAFQAGF
jgi:ABC-type phosphate transport system substrate-binding protein